MQNETERNVAAFGGSFVPRTIYAQRRLAANYGGRDGLLVNTDNRDDVKRVRIDLLLDVDYFPSPATIGIARA